MAFAIVTDPLPVFPTNISFGRPGGPEYNTDVGLSEGANEQRNSWWPEPKYSWDVGYSLRRIDDIYLLLEFFHSCRGKFKPFRFKDWLDFKSCSTGLDTDFEDVTFDAALAGQTVFQLKKNYVKGSYSTTIDIFKPKGDTIRIGEDGVEVFDGWTVNEVTGLLTRATPFSGGEIPTWGGEFYRKARFDVDKLSHTFEVWKVGGVEVPVIGLRGP